MQTLDLVPHKLDPLHRRPVDQHHLLVDQRIPAVAATAAAAAAVFLRTVVVPVVSGLVVLALVHLMGQNIQHLLHRPHTDTVPVVL